MCVGSGAGGGDGRGDFDGGGVAGGGGVGYNNTVQVVFALLCVLSLPFKIKM